MCTYLSVRIWTGVKYCETEWVLMPELWIPCRGPGNSYNYATAWWQTDPSFDQPLRGTASARNAVLIPTIHCAVLSNSPGPFSSVRRNDAFIRHRESFSVSLPRPRPYWIFVFPSPPRLIRLVRKDLLFTSGFRVGARSKKKKKKPRYKRRLFWHSLVVVVFQQCSNAFNPPPLPPIV